MLDESQLTTEQNFVLDEFSCNIHKVNRALFRNSPDLNVYVTCA